MHGGIQATLLDEIAAWTVHVKLQTAGVTANIDLKFRKPVFTDNGNLLLNANIEKVEKRIEFVRTELFNPQFRLTGFIADPLKTYRAFDNSRQKSAQSMSA